MDRIKNIKFTKKLVIKIVLLSPLVLLAILLLVVRPIQVRLEQRDFRAAEAYLEEKKNEIERLAGPAESVEKENSCSYASALVGRGLRYCSTRLELRYATENIDKANELLAILNSVNLGPIYGAMGKPVTSFGEQLRDRKLGQDLDKVNGISCLAFYTYEPESLDITLRCTDEAMTEMYPVNER